MDWIDVYDLLPGKGVDKILVRLVGVHNNVEYLAINSAEVFKNNVFIPGDRDPYKVTHWAFIDDARITS